ncbi:hypothetical protein QUF63_00675 [Anaerolineales bacterium HSG25]|nr:hypothetical protein [Anaerolineales bacterium HSG25]
MTLDWMNLTLFIVIFFAITGFFRGWWKEGLTTIFLAGLVFLLNQPDLAEWLVESYNSLMTLLWSLIPSSMTTISETDTDSVVAITKSTPPDFLLVDASNGSTWFYLLLLAVGIPALWTQTSFNNKPTALGHVLGIGVGAFNGLLIMGLLREYMDGRSLPGGQTGTESAITLASSSSTGTASAEATLVATNFPTYTILDSMIPWIVIIVGALFAFAFFKTRVGSDGKKMVYHLPPLYVK